MDPAEISGQQVNSLPPDRVNRQSPCGYANLAPGVRVLCLVDFAQTVLQGAESF